MRIGIDAREIQNGVYTGIGRALANFLMYLEQNSNDDSCVLFSSQKIPIDFGPRVKNIVVKEQVTFIWDQWQLPLVLKNEKVDIFYSPYYKVPLIKPCILVSAILDLMYLTFEPYYKKTSFFTKAYYACFGRLYAWRADRILTCSEFSKKDIQRVYSVDEKKIKIIPLSVGDIYRPYTGPSNINGRYILYVGNFKEHKNVGNLIEAYASFASDFPDLKLVLAGPKDHTYPKLVEIVNRHGLAQRVEFLGKITEQDQPQILYSKAEVFVMPSYYEGFGLPPLEAMACGVPVVASNTTSVPEVVKDAGLLVDPNNTNAIADAIKKVLTDECLKKDMIAKGLKYAKEYDSKKISEKMYNFFNQLNCHSRERHRPSGEGGNP